MQLYQLHAALGREGGGREVDALARVHVGRDVVEHQVRERFGQLARLVAGRRFRVLEPVDHVAVLHQVTRVVGRKPEVALVAGRALVGQLGQLRAHALDELVGQVVRRQVGVGEHPVVVGGFLHAHDDRVLARRVPMARFLIDLAAFFELLGLAADLVGQPVMQVLEGVDVLELGLRAELLRAAAAQRYVAVGAQAALFHRTVGDAQREEDLAQLLHELARFLGRAQVGLGDELDERRAGAVVVD